MKYEQFLANAPENQEENNSPARKDAEFRSHEIIVADSDLRKTVDVMDHHHLPYKRRLLKSRNVLDSEKGYFGERLQSARNLMVRAWKAKATHLEPKFEYTDVFGSLLLAGEVFRAEPGSQRTLVIYSDMRHHTRQLNLESSSKPPLLTREIRDHIVPIAELKDVQAFALGVDSADKDYDYWIALQRFWKQYFSQAGAHLVVYSVFREHQLD